LAGNYRRFGNWHRSVVGGASRSLRVAPALEDEVVEGQHLLALLFQLLGMAVERDLVALPPLPSLVDRAGVPHQNVLRKKNESM
jgi:hypothetical protein